MQWKVSSRLDDITTKPLIPFSNSTRDELTHKHTQLPTKSVTSALFYWRRTVGVKWFTKSAVRFVSQFWGHGFQFGSVYVVVVVSIFFNTSETHQHKTCSLIIQHMSKNQLFSRLCHVISSLRYIWTHHDNVLFLFANRHFTDRTLNVSCYLMAPRLTNWLSSCQFQHEFQHWITLFN